MINPAAPSPSSTPYLVSVGSRAAVVDLEHGGLLSPVTWLGFSLHI